MPIASFPGGGVRPRLQSATPTTLTRIRALFSESMDPSTVPIGAFSLTANGGSTARTLTGITLGPTYADLDVSGALSTGTAAYTLTVAGTAADLAGNTIDPGFVSAPVDVPTTVLNPDVLDVSSDGGDAVSFDLGIADGIYTVDVGLNPGVSAVRAYGGVAGRGDAAEVIDGVLSFVAPRLAPAEGYRAILTPIAGGAALQTAILFNARRRSLFSSTHALRGALPSRWLVGARDARSEVVE